MSGDQQAQFQQAIAQRQAPGANGGGMQPMSGGPFGQPTMGFGQGFDETMQQQAPGANGGGMHPLLQPDPAYAQQGLLQMNGNQPRVNGMRANGQLQPPMRVPQGPMTMQPQTPIAGYAPEYGQGMPAMGSAQQGRARIRSR